MKRHGKIVPRSSGIAKSVSARLRLANPVPARQIPDFSVPAWDWQIPSFSVFLISMGEYRKIKVMSQMKNQPKDQFTSAI